MTDPQTAPPDQPTEAPPLGEPGDAAAPVQPDAEPAAAETPPASADVANVSDAPAPPAAPGIADNRPSPPREITAVVTSSKPDKTIIVRVDRRIRHPVYGKFIRRSTKFAAHDERNACREGDTVTVVETRPLSKTKSWTLGRIVARGGA